MSPRHRSGKPWILGLMHLIEARDRVQNSTAWLSVEPVDVVPTAATLLH